MLTEIMLEDIPLIRGDFNLKAYLHRILLPKDIPGVVNFVSTTYTKCVMKEVLDQHDKNNLEVFNPFYYFNPQYKVYTENDLMAVFIITPFNKVIMVDIDKRINIKKASLETR